MARGQAPFASAFAFNHGKPMDHWLRLSKITASPQPKEFAWVDFWLSGITSMPVLKVYMTKLASVQKPAVKWESKNGSTL